MPLRVALVHDYLSQHGGAEGVLEVLLEMFPQAHLYTVMSGQYRTAGRFTKNIYKTSMLDFRLARRHHSLLIPLMPYATRSLDLGDRYDLIISNGIGYAKGVPHSPNTFHLSYCFRLPPYVWETGNYFTNPVSNTLLRPIFKYLKQWDYRAAQKPNVMLAVSRFVANQIWDCYERSAAVLYPPVNYRRFYYDGNLQSSQGIPSYYLAFGRMLPHKNFSLLLDTFREMGRTLLVVGSGPEGKKIRRMAAKASNICYIPFVSDAELHSLYNGAKAFIVPQVEDFGLVMAEAQACGTPVIALAEGGALEIVQEDVTGVFFHEQSVEEISEAIRQLDEMNFDRKTISRLSQRFSIKSFKKCLLSHIPAELLNR